MDINEYRRQYHNQKYKAEDRGIGFELTFQEWCEFWGEDITRRGTGQNDLQMQRPCDSGPYAVGNIRKGTPKQNSVTYQAMRRKRECDLAADELQLLLDGMMNESPKEEFDDERYESWGCRMRSSYDKRYVYHGK